MANRTKQSGIMRNSAVTQPYYSYELTRSLTRDPSARIRRTASCRPQTATRPHIHGAKPREGAHGSRTSTTRKSLNPASYRGKSISAPSGPTRNGRGGLAGASTGHLRRGWEQAVSEVPTLGNSRTRSPSRAPRARAWRARPARGRACPAPAQLIFAGLAGGRLLINLVSGLVSAREGLYQKQGWG